MTFSVEYAFINQGEYHDLDAPPRSSENGEPLTVPGAPDLAEQLPHIQFTPYLRLLLRELLAGETDPLKQVRRIYDFVSTRIGYTYMREYAALETICEYGAVNLKGDCGVQAMVFITLCRMAGIPARWQSGLYVTEGYTGPHDWAEFYLEPWGWLFADPSFGGDAWRREDPLGWNYYFGNIDVFRMPANRAILADFTPPKRHRRSDPVDNQRGEVEYEDRGLPSWGFETVHQLISISGGSSQNTA
jgi:transglutaminase-like putative cysteine protease